SAGSAAGPSAAGAAAGLAGGPSAAPAAAEGGPITLDLAIDPVSSSPLYLQLARGLEEAIRSGVLGPGSGLEDALARSMRRRRSRPTARRGMRGLVDTGLLARKRGVGTQVVQAPVTRQVALTSLHADLLAAGKAPRTAVVECRTGGP